MDKIYLVIGNKYSSVIVVRDIEDIDVVGLQKVLGVLLEIWEVGFAHYDTPPGALLSANNNTNEVTRFRPIGKRVL